MAKIVAGADRLVLYEGLPHHLGERELLQRELAEKKTFGFGGFSFYSEAMPLSQEDAAAFTAIFDGADAFDGPPSNPHFTKCGPFHPDYALEWTQGAETVRVQVCLGCNEGKAFHAQDEIHLSLAMDASDTLFRLFRGRRQNRPESKVADHLN